MPLDVKNSQIALTANLLKARQLCFFSNLFGPLLVEELRYSALPCTEIAFTESSLPSRPHRFQKVETSLVLVLAYLIE